MTALIPFLMLLAPTLSAQDAVRIGSAAPAAGTTPDVYVVQPGDTLWEISAKFLGSSEYWPRLWSINDYITNPHWIYPGNRVVFVPGTEIEPPSVLVEGTQGERSGYVTRKVRFEEADLECGPDIRFNVERKNVFLRAPGVLEDDEKLEPVATLYRARRGASMLGEGDTIYLKPTEDHDLECGDVVSIVRRTERRVKHPERAKRYGGLYQVTGEAQVVHEEGGIYTAIIRESYSESMRGDLVVPVIPVDVEMDVQVPRGSLEATVIARLHQAESQLANVGETVFLDRGRADGVRVGNTFYVVERRDEVMNGVGEEDEDLPAMVVGRVVVVRVDETTATAVVVEAARSIRTGARLAMHLE